MIFIKTFLSTIKTQRRSYVFWICAASILLFILRSSLIEDWSNPPSPYDHLHSLLINNAVTPGSLNGNVWLIIAVVCSIDILRLRRDRTKDIVSVSAASDAAVFCAKICAYMLLGLCLWAVCSFAFLFLYLINTGWLSSIGNGIAQVIWMLIQRIIFIAIPTIALYMAISVFFALILNSPAVGIVATAAFRMSGILIPSLRIDLEEFGTYTFFGEYIYQPSEGIVGYWNFHNIHNVSEELWWESSHPNGYRDFALSEIITLAISAILLTLAFVRWHRLHDK